MEYRTDYLAKIAADPSCHPSFDNWREDFDEEAKDGPKTGSKKGKKGVEVVKTENFNNAQSQSK